MFDRSRAGPEFDSGARFERWTLPASGGRVVREVVHDALQEFPRVDERLTGEPHRWVYAVSTRPHLPVNPLYRHDMHTRSTQVHDFGSGRVPGEFVFVPRHEQVLEDEGWLIGFVHNRQTGLAEFHVIHADDFTGPPQAVVHIPARIPAGFHGNWIADADLHT
jgi:carotenoid cleavage dioxygenase